MKFANNWRDLFGFRSTCTNFELFQSSKLGCISEKSKYILFFIRFALTLRLRLEVTFVRENKLKQVLFGFPLT